MVHGCLKSLICSISSQAHSALPNPVVGQWGSLGQDGQLTTYFHADLVQWCAVDCSSHTVSVIRMSTHMQGGGGGGGGVGGAKLHLSYNRVGLFSRSRLSLSMGAVVCKHCT